MAIEYKDILPREPKAESSGETFTELIERFEAAFSFEQMSDIKIVGSEYKGPCPLCGGKDRFIVKKDQSFAWCRQCDTKGDLLNWHMARAGVDKTVRGATIQYLKEVME